MNTNLGKANDRYLNVSTGRFWTMDSFEGFDKLPASLQRYLYVQGDPIGGVDPSGHFLLSSIIYGNRVHQIVGEDFEAKVPGGISDQSVKRILGLDIPGALLRPDLADTFNHLVYEIKPVGSEALGWAQVTGYAVALTLLDPERNIWVPGELYIPPPAIGLNGHAVALVSPPVGGVIIYEVLDTVEVLGLVTSALAYQLYTSLGTATVLTTASAGAY